MASSDSPDHLCLADVDSVAKMIEKNATDGAETVIFSDFVIKINKREKEQTRVLLITDKAVYNLLPSDYGKCKRRISLAKISAITLSTVSDQFVLHVPDEYDYRYKSGKKKTIAEVLRKSFASFAQYRMKKGQNVGPLDRKMGLSEVQQADLKDMTLTKAMAKLQSREQRLRRKKQLLAETHDSDNEDEKDIASNATTNSVENMLKTSDKVRLEDFELLKVLGRGSFGKVMQVRKKSDGNIYAMKILKKRAIIDRNQVEHTKAERNILQQLQHPFLMTLRYAFQSKEKLYFVLDYYQGGELFFHLKNKRRFSEEVARLYVAEIGLALGHLHALNVVYRDLKPENILLDQNGHVCLTDFGLSKDIDPHDQAHTFCGTPEYLAPEIVTGAGHGKAVDWWSLGILLYELTVGIPPFYSNNVNEMYNKIQHGVLRFPPFLSDPCKSLIVSLLHRDPQKRLGAGPDDFESIKKHEFFAALDFDKLMKKEIESPYKPKVKGVADTDNFDDTFTSEPVVDTVVQDSAMAQAKDDADFSGFTFQEKSQLT